MTAPLPSHTAHRPDSDPVLARLTDAGQISIFNWANSCLPADVEWFDLQCDADGRITLTPAKSIPAEAHAWARQRDQITAAQSPRPYSHLTLDELRNVEMTQEERIEELRARGVLSGAAGPLHIEPVSPPVPPGALARFLKERG